MSATDIRQGDARFYDNVHFYRGFSKSGDFTLAEDEILTYFGTTLLALENGQLEPENQTESDFVDMTKGNREASTKLERTWMKYVHLARGKKSFSTLNSKPNLSDDDNAYSIEDDRK